MLLKYNLCVIHFVERFKKWAHEYIACRDCMSAGSHSLQAGVIYEMEREGCYYYVIKMNSTTGHSHMPYFISS